MPPLGLGTWQLTNDTSGIVENALWLGYRMIDTSGDYGTQKGIGQGIRRSGIDREDVYLVTKIEEDDDAYEATTRNLSELDLDYADLMLIHRPPESGAGTDLWEGLIQAKADGFARDIGVSNYSIDQIGELIGATDEVPAVNQIEWSPFGWSAEMLDYCREWHIVIQSYSPLTRGDRLNDPRLGKIAADHGKTSAQLVIRWNLQLGVVPLPKANKPEHLEENLLVFDFELNDEDMTELNDLNEQWSSLGPRLQYL
jgi:diketogulonate reductase-like aldo/keto reductase